MISSLRVRNVATYDEEGISFDQLNKINFIYGANGSGKTTISNFISNNLEPKFSNCSIQWENNFKQEVLVYNKSFKENNFAHNKLKGIFTLGEATKNEMKIIEDKQKELEEIKEKIIKKEETLKKQIQIKEKLEENFKEEIWIDIYKKYENYFKEAFFGVLHKEKFKNKFLEEIESNNFELKEIENLKERAEIIFKKELQKMETINLISFDKILEIEKNKIWEKIIIGKADINIAELIKKLNISDWVNEGRKYIKDDICPFCQQKTITNTFNQQLKIFFDENYTVDINILKKFKEEYNYLKKDILNELNIIESEQKLLLDSKLNIDEFSTVLKVLTNLIITNNEYINNKIKEPSRKIKLISIEEQLNLIVKIVNDANNKIEQHNKLIENYKLEKNNLIKEIWKFVAEEYRNEVVKFNKNKKGLEKGILNLKEQYNEEEKKYKELESEIKKLNQSITSIQPTINEINKILKLYGFLNFKIVPSKEEGFYQIEREDGSIANDTLSEGEVSFITFLYYLQLVKGGFSEEEVSKEKVLIVDDPISSLDSNILFVVSILLKNIIKTIKNNEGNIKQLIILTHNVYFHKEVSFIDGRTKESNLTNYWILRKNGRITTLEDFGVKNPIQSSYSLLWEELKSKNTESIITIQNIMRRIIENYFKLLGKYGDDELILNFKTKEEKEICQSLIAWINDGSHSVNDDLFIELPSYTIEIYKKVFKEIFDLTGHSGHYEMMMRD